MSNPKISVLVPIFNVEKYLRECLNSIAHQTLKDIEIICINDGSTDSSLDIIQEYAAKDSRFVIVNKKNSGYGDSMNKGLAKATGEYVGIVESDDFIERDMFKKLFSLAKKNDAEVVKSNFFYYYTDLTKTSPQWDEQIGAVYNRERKVVVTEHNTLCNLVNKKEVGRVINPFKNRHIFYQRPAIWSAIYKRAFLDKNKIRFLPTPGASYQDTAFGFKVWASAARAVFTDEAFLHYRQDNEASSVNSPGKVFCVADEYREIEDFLAKRGLTQELGPMAQATKYGAYSWNFGRLADGLDADFLKLFSREYSQADKKGVLDYGYFNSDMRRNLHEIISDQKLFLARKKARSNATISIIVPVYNTAQYVAKCLDSLLGQTYKDIEIICINDGSSDHSLEILERYYKNDPRIVLLDTPNRGPAAARNHALQQASGSYLMFCDSDDTYPVDACQALLDAISKSKADIAIGEFEIQYTTDELALAYRRTDEDYYKLKYDGKIKLTDNIIKNVDVSLCNKIFKSSLQKRFDIKFPKGMWYEDAAFFNNYISVSDSAFFLRGKKTYQYVRRAGGIMATTAQKTPKAVDHTKIMFHWFYFLKKYNLFEKRRRLFVENFERYYQFSRKHTPEDRLDKLTSLVEGFLRKNRSYLRSIDPSLTNDIRRLLPRVPKKVTTKRIMKKILKKPVTRSMHLLSPTYRRQTHIMSMINDLSKKIDKVNSSNNRQMESIRSQITSIETALKTREK